MRIRRVVYGWLGGWRDLLYYDSIPGYRACAWPERTRLDCLALRYLLGLSRFRCAGLSLIAVQLLVLSLAWHCDLTGWRRDLLRAGPGLFVLPWLASARKIAIDSILRNTQC